MKMNQELTILGFVSFTATVLLQLELPPSWALKPVGAAYSEGLILIREGMDLLTGFPWNAWHAIGIMRGLQQQQQERMAAADAAHSVVQYNCESFIVEELVQDRGAGP